MENLFSPSPRLLVSSSRPPSHGFTLLELVITITVLTILTLGVIPMMKVSVKRQKEQQLRETLREIRTAIDQFHREAIAGAQAGAQAQAQQQQQQQQQRPQQQPPQLDPRIRVYVSDQTIFTVDNPDRYPPDLDTLVKGVDVLPFATGSMGGRGNLNVNATEVGREQATAKKKVYLRLIPIDPMTGTSEWDLRSCYDAPDSSSWGGENVFDVHSKSKETALNGEKYSDW
ncbi:MAG: type II secretion system protein [Pyrinomonadaceae bacterium]